VTDLEVYKWIAGYDLIISSITKLQTTSSIERPKHCNGDV